MPVRTLTIGLCAVSMIAAAGHAAGAAAQQAAPAKPKIDWVHGPAKVDLGDGIAQIDLPKGYVFAGGNDTRRLMESMGNIPRPDDVGLIAPTDKPNPWFLHFSYKEVGFVKDDEKDKIDAQKLLDSIREGTEEANKERAKRGFGAVHVVRWFDEPHYDSATHNLVWAIEGSDDSAHRVVNYDVRLLGRRGYMSVKLVADPEEMAGAKQDAAALLGGFSYKQGSRYAEFVSGDKVAEYGLAALVVGGAGAVAAKLGLFAKLGKFLAGSIKLVIAGIVALFAAIRRFFGFGKKDKPEVSAP